MFLLLLLSIYQLLYDTRNCCECMPMQMDLDRLRQRCYPFWVAPELLQRQAPSTSSDVYALGMLIYEMLYRREPFSGEEPEVLHACSTSLCTHAQITQEYAHSTHLTCPTLLNMTCTLWLILGHNPLMLSAKSYMHNLLKLQTHFTVIHAQSTQ